MGNEKRKRVYRQKVECSICKRQLQSDYSKMYSDRYHKDMNVTYKTILDPKQMKISFGSANLVSSSNNNNKNAVENPSESEGKDIESDATIVEIVDSSSGIVDQVDPRSNNNFIEDISESKMKGIENVKSLEVTAVGPPVSQATSSIKTNPTTCVSEVLLMEISSEKFSKESKNRSECDDSEDELSSEQRQVQQGNLSSPNQPKLKSYDPRMYGKWSRDFKYEWFERYPWLSYDEEFKIARCFSCEKFLKDSSFRYNNWKKPERLLKHGQSQMLSLGMLKWIDAKRTEADKTTILSLMESEHAKSVEENRRYLKLIIETLMFTAVQNISIRGATESRDEIENISDINRGNFLELLSLRARDNAWLQSKLGTSVKDHTSFTSPAIQNEILSILAEFTLRRIEREIKESEFYALIADETFDITRDEQLSVCFSYVINGIKRRLLLGFTKWSEQMVNLSLKY